MNRVRDVISNVFQAPMANMSFVHYFNYINETGKLTPRSLMEVCVVILTFLEEQEKKNELYEANFNNIMEILNKLTQKEAPIETSKESLPIEPLSEPKKVVVDKDTTPVTHNTPKTVV